MKFEIVAGGQSFEFTSTHDRPEVEVVKGSYKERLIQMHRAGNSGSVDKSDCIPTYWTNKTHNLLVPTFTVITERLGEYAERTDAVIDEVANSAAAYSGHDSFLDARRQWGEFAAVLACEIVDVATEALGDELKTPEQLQLEELERRFENTTGAKLSDHDFERLLGRNRPDSAN